MGRPRSASVGRGGMKRRTLKAGGQLWLGSAVPAAVGERRVALLESIRSSGSISQAARDIGMSYKAAWDAVDAMNNLADAPLVERSVGGRHGGGTRLTAEGERLVAVYRAAQAEFEAFMRRLSAGVADFDRFYPLMRRLGMKTSARNEFAGTVKAIVEGAIDSEIVLDLGDGTEIVSVITNASVSALGLAPGMTAYALIKAPWVILTAVEGGLRVGARNCLRGEITAIEAGTVNSEVTLQLAGGKRLTAVVTNASLDALGLAPGDSALACVKASHVIVAVNA